MATVLKSVGLTGRDYAVPKPWADVIPADLIAALEHHRAEFYNDGELTPAVFDHMAELADKVTDGSHFVEMVAAAGQAFYDNMSASDPLRYDPGKGVALRQDSVYYNVLKILRTRYVEIQGLQMKSANASGTNAPLMVDSPPDNGLVTIRRCIIHAPDTFGAHLALGPWLAENCLIIVEKSTAKPVFAKIAEGSFVNCTFAVPSDGSPGTAEAFEGYYNGAGTTFESCAIMGAGGAIYDDALTQFKGSHNVTDLASLGSTVTDSITGVNYADCFEDNTLAGGNWRPKAGSPLIGAGKPGGPSVDIFGNPRSPTAPTVGCVEFIPQGGGSSLNYAGVPVSSYCGQSVSSIMG